MILRDLSVRYDTKHLQHLSQINGPEYSGLLISLAMFRTPVIAAIVSQEKPARPEISVLGQFSSRGCLRSFLLLIMPFYEIIECQEKLAEDIFLGGDGSLWKRTV